VVRAQVSAVTEAMEALLPLEIPVQPKGVVSSMLEATSSVLLSRPREEMVVPPPAEMLLVARERDISASPEYSPPGSFHCGLQREAVV
jgi:hypothetical protein